MPGDASWQKKGGGKESLLDRAIDVFKPQPGPPPKPAAPRVNQHAWEESVEQAHVVPGLKVHEVGLSFVGETRSLTDRPGARN